jgi:hypothetical protein
VTEADVAESGMGCAVTVTTVGSAGGAWVCARANSARGPITNRKALSLFPMRLSMRPGR